MNPEPELSWIGSVSIGGLRGGKFRKRDVEVAISALERKIKGASRQRAARIRIENEFERLTREPVESIETILRLIGIVEHNDRERVSQVCFVDIELGASAEIRELGVAIEIGGQMYTGRGGPESIGALDAILAGRLVVAHNGSQHDFPVCVRLASGPRLTRWTVCIWHEWSGLPHLRTVWAPPNVS